MAELVSALADAERRAADVVALRQAVARAEDRARELEAEGTRMRVEGQRELDAARLAVHDAIREREEVQIELQRVAAELEQAVRGRQRAEATLARATSSASWRLTAPLRALKRRLGR